MPYLATVNNQVSVMHRVLDLSGSLVTSSVSGFTATLYNPSLTTKPTLVTWSSPVTGGYAYFVVTPDQVGTWYLQVTNPTTNSDGASYDYYIQTVDASVGLPPSGTLLTTLTNLKEQLDIPASTTTYDNYLTNLIARATGMIEARLGRGVLSATYTEYFDGGGDTLELQNGPLQSITSVCSMNYQSGTGTVSQTLSAATYLGYGYESDGWLMPARVVANSWCWTEAARLWRVVYVGGFAYVPYDIEQLCLNVCVFLYNQRKDTGTTSRDVGSGAIPFRSQAELWAMIDQGLAPYRAT